MHSCVTLCCHICDCKQGHPLYGAAVLIIRNPLNALVAEWKRQKIVHTHAQPHVGWLKSLIWPLHWRSPSFTSMQHWISCRLAPPAFRGLVSLPNGMRMPIQLSRRNYGRSKPRNCLEKASSYFGVRSYDERWGRIRTRRLEFKRRHFSHSVPAAPLPPPHFAGLSRFRMVWECLCSSPVATLGARSLESVRRRLRHSLALSTRGRAHKRFLDISDIHAFT